MAWWFSIWRIMDSDMYDGYGRLVHQNGDIYEGDWHHGKDHGSIDMRK